MSLRKHFDSMTIFIIITMIVAIAFWGISTQIQSNEEKRAEQDKARQVFEVKLLETLVKNDVANNHNFAVMIHNQGVLVEAIHNHDNKSVVVQELRTDFIPLGNNSLN